MSVQATTRTPESKASSGFVQLQTGVYLIRNKVNGKVYVGSAALSLATRQRQHWRALRKGAHKNRHLQAAWDGYGEESFEFVVIEYCQPHEALTVEQEWLDYHRASEREFGYNAHHLAKSALGVKRSAETRAKVSAAVKANGFNHRGLKRSPETRAKLSAIGKARGAPDGFLNSTPKGSKRTEETRAKISAGLRGRPVSAETRAKIGAANAAHQKGRIHTKELRAKITETKRQRYVGGVGEKAMARMKAGLFKGRKHSDESKAKMSAAHKGRKLSPEAIAKGAAARRGRKADPEVVARRVATRRANRLAALATRDAGE